MTRDISQRVVGTRLDADPKQFASPVCRQGRGDPIQLIPQALLCLRLCVDGAPASLSEVARVRRMQNLPKHLSRLRVRFPGRGLVALDRHPERFIAKVGAERLEPLPGLLQALRRTGAERIGADIGALERRRQRPERLLWPLADGYARHQPVPPVLDV